MAKEPKKMIAFRLAYILSMNE